MISQAVTLFACAVIFFTAEPVLNRMGPSSALGLRASFWLLVVGAVSVVGAILTGWQSTPPVAACLTGVALLLRSNRRAEP
jgi:divalent metal cation (Fe/Co/Zn/Cd) transporter